MDTPKKQDYASTLKGKHGIKRLINAIGYSRDGIKAAFEEAGFRELLLLHAVLLIILCFVHFSLPVKMILVMASFMSLIVELFNTGIEASVDHTSLERHPLAKRAKDVGSAAQYTSLTMIAVLWIMAATLG
ncbi:diacylglycerol kinase [Cardiobacteriaceae bacterium TAE3-ERU3]|nr:diacylglycerol kinase [Cardiobacteriaceae bacterium TAE3-ERU3]